MLSLVAKSPRHSGQEGLKASLGTVLEADRRRRDANAARQASNAKAEKRRTDKVLGEAMRTSDRIQVNSVVSPDVRRHGDYRAVDFKLVEVTEGGKRKEKTAKVIRNVGGSPVERWHVRGRLTEREMAAVLFYQSAWAAWIGEPRVTANYSPAISRNANGAVELWASSRIRAKESLRLLDQEVFFRLPVEHFHVWQNVVIWDEPAGVAGGRAGFVSTKQSEAVARVIVCLVAKMIADVVIDSSRSDFGDLLLDLDAPRRPGRRR